jgi:glycosyltransferase involved in cell wall biosynthesis
VVLVGGETPDSAWLAAFRSLLDDIPVTCAIERAAGYASEMPARPAAVVTRIRALLARVLPDASPSNCLVWAHNLGLGRNLLLARELTRICVTRRLPLVSHHHDWWFDNRWQRWPEMRCAGFRSLAAVAATIFPTTPTVRHATINRFDWQILNRHFRAQAGWVPNLGGPPSSPSATQVRQTRRWLRDQLGETAPVWLVPCRLLRRKNLAEALLLTRWLRPEAWLVTTGGASSADEAAYAAALGDAARRHGWRMRLGVLAGGESGKPSVPALLAASETVLLTSLQEGFGLPNLEAAAAGRPLIVRTLPNIAPDLALFGYRFPQSYDELLVAPELFDRQAEHRRQTQRWQDWRRQLPRSCRSLADTPPWLAAGDRPVPFSRLTLLAQLEVLAHPAELSWTVCAPLNPGLGRWRRLAATGRLAASNPPRGAAHWLGERAYARHFSDLLQARPAPALSPAAGSEAAAEFFRAKLAGANQYPLLWTRTP